MIPDILKSPEYLADSDRVGRPREQIPPVGSPPRIHKITSKGVAGVPRASLVVILATLKQFGLPEAGLFLILGIDQFLDMGRSATNVIGNSLAASAVAKFEEISARRPTRRRTRRRPRRPRPDRGPGNDRDAGARSACRGGAVGAARSRRPSPRI